LIAVFISKVIGLLGIILIAIKMLALSKLKDKNMINKNIGNHKSKMNSLVQSIISMVFKPINTQNNNKFSIHPNTQFKTQTSI
jgi:hypothetical protein